MLKTLKKLFKNRSIEVLTYPNNTDLIWNKGLAMCCEYYNFTSNHCLLAYQKLNAGSLIWIKGSQVSRFFREVFPKIKQPFILISGDSTISLPKEIMSDELQQQIASPLLLHWYTQNCDLDGMASEKISPIPLGIDFHSQFEGTSWRFSEIASPKEQELQLMKIRDSQPAERHNLAYADFHFNNSSRHLVKRDIKISKNRRNIYKQLSGNQSVFFQAGRLERVKLWQQMVNFDFVISPHGSGLDCHRTWEALALGCYVIVEKSCLDPLYASLPVKIVDDFEEITAANLALWKRDFQANFDYSEYKKFLTNTHWLAKIRANTPV